MLRDLSAATLHLIAFLLGSLLWMLAMGAALAVVWMVRDPSLLSGPVDLADLDGLTMGLSSALQIVGLAALAALLAMAMGTQPDAEGRRAWWSLPQGSEVGARLRRHLALRRFPWVWGVVGFAGGLTVWTFPSFVATWLVDTFGFESVSLEATTRLLLEGPLLDRLAMGFAVVGTAPLFEELIFRGYLWEVAERATGRWGAFAVTTLLFAAYHIDPVHMVSLLPTAVFLGALRMASGSLWPGVLAHLANNGIAVVIAVLTQHLPDDDTLPLWISLSGTALTALVFLAGYTWSRARPLPDGAPP